MTLITANAHACPKCGAKMEPIEIADERIPLQELQLCPNCYLVAWNGENGPQFGQGVPVGSGKPRPRTIN